VPHRGLCRSADQKLGRAHAADASDPPPEIAVPDGNHLAFVFFGSGAQIYTCTGDGLFNGPATPDATLFDDNGDPAGIHFAGPTWQANDGSSVVGARIAAVTPDPSAIPWLLLGAAQNNGDGIMSNVTFVQRLDTTGGLAPTDSCGCSDNGCDTARIDYTANYAFSVAD
jgi:hypothetical protein